MRYASRFEGTFASALQQAGVSYTYEPYELEIWVPQNATYICDECDSTTIAKQGWYVPDFVTHDDKVLETKGKWDAKDRKKMDAVVKQWPDLDIVMIFMRDNYLTKSKHGTYTSWCKKNNIDYYVAGDIARSKQCFSNLLEYLREKIK